MLIDDEQLIVEGLKKVVKWADYRCEVVATASDAVSGAASIRQFQPHILFTDIRMPGDDGLTMLAGLKSEYPDMQVICSPAIGTSSMPRRRSGCCGMPSGSVLSVMMLWVIFAALFPVPLLQPLLPKSWQTLNFPGLGSSRW